VDVQFDASAVPPVKAVGHVSTGGSWPRNFAVSPDGKLVAALNQKSNNLVMFDATVDGDKLSLTAWPTPLAFPLSPMCARFV
jgi:6-phosphogluconolactonase